MATNGTLAQVTGSPNENYNPLADEGDLFPEGDDSDVENEPSSLENSLDNDGNFTEAVAGGDPRFRYGVTPPSNARERKRSKERKKSSKSGKSPFVSRVEPTQSILRRNRRTSRNSQRGEVVRDSFGDDPVTCDIGVNGLDPTEISEMFKLPTSPEKKRKDSSKSLKTNRSYDRDLKHNSIDHLISDFGSAGSSMVIDSTQKFSCLNSKPVSSPGPNKISVPPSVSVSPLLVTPAKKDKQVPLGSLDCPRDRVHFYETFSTLINLGNPAKKDKEREGKLSRQHSCEQEIWQNRMSDLIWLEVRAWHSGRTSEEEDRFMCKARQRVPLVLDKVYTFKVTPLGDPTPLISITEQVSIPNADEQENGNFECVNTPTSGKSLNEAVSEHKVALLQVAEVLEELAYVESLYPTLKAVGREYNFYTQPTFQQRVDTLCLWMNITKDIGHKLQLMAKVLYVDSLRDWPWLDYESPHQILRSEHNMLGSVTPDICVTTPLSEEDRELDWPVLNKAQFLSPSDSVNKNVRFNIDSGPPSPDPDREFSFASGASDTSTPNKSVNRTNSFMSFVENSRTGKYRYFVDKTLKRTGLMKLLQRLKHLLDGTLQRARQALEKPKALKEKDLQGKFTIDSPTELMSTSPSLDGEATKYPYIGGRRESLVSLLSLGSDFATIGLPSFKPMYLFLVRIPLDVVHECLRLRIEQRPESDPSPLSVRQLIRECKEVLLGAVIVKQWYQQMVIPAVSEEDLSSELDLECFEADVQEMLDVYFDYIQTWMNCLQQMPEMSKRLKNFLEEEWIFSKRVCPHVRGGDAKAGNRFCLMASSLLQSISDFLDTGIDECINQLYDSTTAEGTDDNDVDDGNHLCKRSSRSVEVRQAIIQTCRHFKNHFHEARERASKALGFAKMLRKDLEIAADFQIKVPSNELMDKLNETQHHQVIAPHNTGYLMFVPHFLANDKEQILQLLNVTSGREDVLSTNEVMEEGYLLLVKCEGCADHPPTCPLWRGEVTQVEPTADTTIALSHIEVGGMLLVVSHSSRLRDQTKNFEKTIGPAVCLASEQTSCHQAIAESLAELKTAAIDFRERVAVAITQVDEKLNMDDISEMDENEKCNIQKLYRETLHQCYNFGFEYHKEVIRLVSGEKRTNLAHRLVEFAKQWMKFVAEKCERGRGVRPRWASQGLDFLCTACEPRVMATLAEEQFRDLKECMNRCITHVIGDKASGGNMSPGFRVSSPDLTAQRHNMLRHVSLPETRPHRVHPPRNIQSEPPTPRLEIGPAIKKSISANDTITGDHKRLSIDGIDFAAGSKAWEDRDDDHSQYCRLDKIREKLYQLEKERSTKLFQSHVIGRATEQKVELDYNISIRRVNFKWQRGIKIGEGQFGKVYTAVNMDSGQMMAVKEIRFAPNDHQTIKEVADEIKLFEGIQHASLVQYFGVELHRDEMLIFMEYCTEGTIEEVAKQGLTEAMIRKYTMEILVAIKELHDHSIVHRDIKGANIFLTSNGPLKLGDFGCSIKLKSHTTMPGEVNNMVGTTAFMAPEVITRNEGEGSGRAADVWSLGCVVIEMATGKRPWHELENNYQIMFKVGMGAIPAIPDSLSEEGQDFLQHCLEADPKHRWIASQLQDHPFVKVYSEDDVDVN